MNLDRFTYFYFIGLGGIGMSALARYFNDQGKTISGYDKTPSEIISNLNSLGITCHFNDNIDEISKEFLDKDQCIIVYTPAIPEDHKELNFFKNNGFEVRKRSEILGFITQDKCTIAVGGTHGKTSTSCLLTHLLVESGIGCQALIGGISVNYNSNYISSKGNSKREIFVVEADEYDRSFLKLSPDVAIINSIDPDHLDIYGSENDLINTYNEFANRLNHNGSLCHYEKANIKKPPHAKNSFSYGLSISNDFRALNIKAVNGSYQFDVETPKGTIKNIVLNVAGDHNVLNLLAALSALYALVDKDLSDYINAISTFQGVKRRFEYILKTNQIVFIDDYAHHPTEINSTIDSCKKLFPDKKSTGIFQPHLFSRTRDFAKGFAESLSKLDQIILLDIYPAREKPIDGVSSKLIFDLIQNPNKLILGKDELLEYLKNNEFELLLTLGAGDIDRLVKPIKELLEYKY